MENKKQLLVGDIHGELYYLAWAREMNPDADIVVVGDVGIGFGSDSIIFDALGAYNIKHIRGNHDNPRTIKQAPGHIPDGTVKDGVLYIGGAWSIDGPTGAPGLRGYRDHGMGWWPEEELTSEEWREIYYKPEGFYEDVHTVVSHDCPQHISNLIHPNAFTSRTGEWLEKMLQVLPNVKRWFFGHHHRQWERSVGGVLYRCINIGEVVDMDDFPR